MWPAERTSRIVVDRMHAYGRGDAVRMLHFPDAGHQVVPDLIESLTKEIARLPKAMQTKVRARIDAFDFGGSPQADAAADSESRPEALRCLRAHIDARDAVVHR